jgi:branched-chain amino acid aminotransferase
MATGLNIKTFFEGTWYSEDKYVMRAADHGSWLGTSVFDGARYLDGVAPDLKAHCERVNQSAEAMMISPTITADDMVQIILDGLQKFQSQEAVYIRPMYWAIDGDELAIVPQVGKTGFAICLEELPMAKPDAAATLTTTRFRRPVLEDNVVNAKAGCLYPNNARMLAEARSRGCSNALVGDVMGNVAETATANIFIVRDGEIFTPIPNGTFLAGITRARHIKNLRSDGYKVNETIITFKDVHDADEVFMSGNMMKVTPVKSFDETNYQIGPITKQVRSLYWDWAHSVGTE